eukprot:PRCOL_00006610-RA
MWSLLVTGATGFLAKVLLEKILYEVPDVGTCYLLIQRRGALSARERLEQMVASSPAFDRLRARHGDDYARVMGAKLVAVEGSIGEESLGMSADDLAAVQADASVVVNSAATTAFDERYDVAMNVNALGPQRVLDVAKGCAQLELVLHVSTAFVNGLREGATPERAFAMGDCIAAEMGRDPGAPRAVDVRGELAMAMGAEERLRREHAGQSAGGGGGGGGAGASEADAYVTTALQALGTERASMHGWQDTYVFTKAMGEMLLGEGARAHGVPLAICRPSIVESALREPHPGWVEGIRMCDPIIIAYGKGQLRGFLGDRNGVLDVVPVDHVVNAMLAAMPAHARAREGRRRRGERREGVGGEGGQLGQGQGRQNGQAQQGRQHEQQGRVAQGPPPADRPPVFHVATSVANPLGIEQFVEHASRHFAEHPMADPKTGEPIRVDPMAIYPDERSFLRDSWLRYQLPLKLASLLPWRDARKDSRRAAVLQKVFDQLAYLASIYASYTFYAGRFDAARTRELYEGLDDEERELFGFDARAIDWGEYMGGTHPAGLRKFVLKKPVRE